jgi:capsular exopolysaccharide synthesis family protein
MTTLPQTTSIQLPRPVGATPITVPGPTHLGAPAQQGGMTGSDVWRVIRSNLWLIIGSVVAAVFIGFGLNWFLMTFYARYTAVGYVEVQPGAGQIRSPLGEGMQQSDAWQTNTLTVELRTQATKLHTDALFYEVLKNANRETRNSEWFKQFKKPDGGFDLAQAKEDLAEKFSPVPINDSRLIAVSFTYSEPRDCRTVVMDLVEQHIENERKANTDKINKDQAFLQNLLLKYNTQARALRNDTAVKAAKLQLDGWGRPGGVALKEQEMGQLISERLKKETIAQSAKEELDATMQQLQAGTTPPRVEMMVSQHPMVMNWEQNVHELDVSLNSLGVGPDHPAYKRLAERRDEAQRKLDEIRAVQRATNTDIYLDTIRGAAAGTQHELEAVNKQIEKLRNDLSELTTDLTDYLTKKDDENSFLELAKRVQKQVDVLQTHSTSMDLNTVRWGMMPETPDLPSFPQLRWVLAGCVAIALVLSLSFSFLREVMDTSVRSPRDIARVGNLNFLGMIPHEDDDPQSAGVPLATIIYGAPTSMMAEQFRQVRTRLQHAASLDTTRSILITSPGPEDGKSTVACNLAAGLALNGRKILLVDANFRRPELHKIFDVANESGFGTALGSIENFEGAIRQTKVPNLDVMPTGPKPANSTELLESQLLIDFIERALEEYDHVIFDSGPILVVADTVALAPRVDGVVTVVRARTNTRGLLQRMKDTLRQLKAEHLGVVLNGVRAQAGGYYNRNIKTYYEYQNGHAG